MEKDPYQAILEALRGRAETPSRLRLGTVAALTPLTVEVAGTLQTGNLRVNAALLPLADGPLDLGDTVLLFSEDDQSFIILCKVVSA